MIKTLISARVGINTAAEVALNEQHIKLIQERKDDRDEYWKSKIIMTDGSEYLSLDTMSSLLAKIKEASK